METYKDYIKRKSAETQSQLQKQSAINADVAANAMESAAIAAANTHAEATSGGMIDSNAQPETVTAARDMLAQQETAQPGTEGPTDEKPELRTADIRSMKPGEEPHLSTENPADIKPEDMPRAENLQKEGAMKPMPMPYVKNPSTEGMLNNYSDDNARMIAIAKDVVGQQNESNSPWYESAYPGWKVIREDSGSGWIDIESPDGVRKRIRKNEPIESRMWLAPRPGSPADQGQNGGTAQTSTEGTPKSADDSASTSEKGSYEGQIKLFSDLINERSKEKERQEAEMRAQEKANTISTMATGATEVAAGIINMLAVGEGHASNQQYKSYSQDWMRKAEADLKEHRQRHENMQATIDRLRAQQEQVRTAARIEDMRLRQQKAQAEQKAAEEEENRKLREQKIKDDRDADMLSRGFVPDENAPGGYRFDPDLAAQIAAAKKAPKNGGNVNYAPSMQNVPTTKTKTGSSTTAQGGRRKNITVPTEEDWGGETKSNENKWSGYKVS